MITPRRQLGNKGEDLACDFLIKNGFHIIERNYSNKLGELDIVAKKGNDLHFIEVKSGHNSDNINPVENLNYHKIRKFTRIARSYLLQKNISNEQRWQMDAVVVVFGAGGSAANISYLENINIL